LNEDNQADVSALKAHVRRLEAELKLVKERALLQQSSISQGIKESALFGVLEKVRRCEKDRDGFERDLQSQKDMIEKKDKQLQVCVFPWTFLWTEEHGPQNNPIPRFHSPRR